MPVENLRVDGRHWARPVVQHHERLPLIRSETPRERTCRRLRGLRHWLLMAAGAAIAVVVQELTKGL